MGIMVAGRRGPADRAERVLHLENGTLHLGTAVSSCMIALRVTIQGTIASVSIDDGIATKAAWRVIARIARGIGVGTTANFVIPAGAADGFAGFDAKRK